MAVSCPFDASVRSQKGGILFKVVKKYFKKHNSNGNVTQVSNVTNAPLVQTIAPHANI